MIQPIFLFSLPRSGSTFLQRVLSTHPQIASRAEPWILLPLFYGRRGTGITAEYDQKVARQAIDDFLGSLPDGEARFNEMVRRFALGLYAAAASSGERYFLDKTPRYALICREVMTAFPNAKHIFLWRNPLSVVASMSEAWGKFRLVAPPFRVDLHDGLANLVACFEANRDRVVSVRYEDLVRNPEAESARMLDYLELDPAEADVSNFARVVLDGRMGDKLGSVRYVGITQEPVEKWRTAFASVGRKRWARRYLDWIGRERLATMGYDHDQLRAELDALRARPFYLPKLGWIAAGIRRRLGTS